MLDDFVDVFQASRILHVHPETVRRLIRQGDIPARKVANKWFIAKDQLAQFAGYYNHKRGLQRKLL